MQKKIEGQKQKEKEMLEKTGEGKVQLSRKEIRELRTAETVLSTAIHPDTGEFIPWPMRMSSFIPMNMPITFGLIIAAPTPLNTIFWQWVNQTYNAAVNYGNRNATSVYTKEDLVKSYTAATVTSIGVALGVRKMLEKRTRSMKGAKLLVFNSFSSFLAISSAGFLNAYLMRQTELKRGVDIYDPADPTVIVGKSQAAAQKAVM